MIKKMIILFAVLMMMAPFTALAEVQSSVGLKTWYNSWQMTQTNQATNTTDSIKSDSAVLMVGPTVNFKFDNSLFVGASYLVTTSDYEFTQDGVDPGAGKYTYVDTNDRKDLDLIGGFMFTQRFGVYVGYKSMSFASKYHFTSQFYGTGSGDNGTDSITGPGVGILGNMPIGQSPVVLYGNLGFVNLKDEYKDASGATQSTNMSGSVLEIGVAASFTDNISANIGIKSQQIKGTSEGNEVKATFAGFTAGVNYTF